MVFQIGDRVKVSEKAAWSYIQPWRGRFEKGRAGTIIQMPSANVRGYLVKFDHGKVKYPKEWEMVMRGDELVKV